MKRYIKEVIFIIIWSVIFMKLFVVDVERQFIEYYFMEFKPYFAYRVFFYSLILIVCWYIIGNKRFFKNLGYLVFYPIILLLWKVPKIFFWQIPKILYKSKSWLLIYAYINSWINHFWQLKYNILRFLLLMVSLILIFKSNNVIILYVVNFFILGLLISLLVDKFKTAFQPLRLFKLNLELSNLKDKEKYNVASKFIDNLKETEDVENLDEEDSTKNELSVEKKQKENIEQIILIKSIFSFVTIRMKDFLSRKTYIVVFFLKILVAFLNAWFLISLLNYGAYKISESNFAVNNAPNFFDFVYYTFHSMLHGTIPHIVPSGVLGKVLDILAPFTGLLLTGTLLTVFFTVKTDKYKENLAEIIGFTETQLSQFENVLIEKYNFTLSQAVKFLESKKSYVCIIVKELDKIE
ncbi:hypothetical protein [Marinifilum sp. D737]|uniref:hypothetical protein n=1 Tax=Marinifilum sp. D737 TaxID=2969628 RepID=UPI002272C3F6|nr:hypothetical protein [Marinifilum sp. D737]MCY1634400.1 hypothetical protein [Marinifilum sp. D737]